MTIPSWNELRMAFADSNKMDHVARYHQIGRRFADLSDAELNRIWVDAFRACYDRRRTDRSSTWRDADAELMLRRLPPPRHLIPPTTLKRIQARARDGLRRLDASPQLKEDIDHFMRQCFERRN